MKRVFPVIALVTAACGILIGVAQTAPVPSEAATKWQVDIEYDRPRPILVQLPGQKDKTLFWYMIYRAVNRSGADRRFNPKFDLYTDTGQLMRAERGVPLSVFDAIKSLHDEPTLVSTTVVYRRGKILQGEDNAVHSVAIWQDFDAKAGAFDVFVEGLSGESATIKLLKPVKAVKVRQYYDKESKKLVTERKEVMLTTLQLTKQLQTTWAIPGEARARTRTPIESTKARWIMR